MREFDVVDRYRPLSLARRFSLANARQKTKAPHVGAIARDDSFQPQRSEFVDSSLSLAIARRLFQETSPKKQKAPYVGAIARDDSFQPQKSEFVDSSLSLAIADRSLSEALPPKKQKPRSSGLSLVTTRSSRRGLNSSIHRYHSPSPIDLFRKPYPKKAKAP
jgi:hypothetical protein